MAWSSQRLAEIAASCAVIPMTIYRNTRTDSARAAVLGVSSPLD